MTSFGSSGGMQFNDSVLQWFNDLAAQGILVTDGQLNIRGWNRWMEIHSGQDAAQVIGQNLLDLYPELVERRLEQYYRDALDGQVRVLSQRLHGFLLPMSPEDGGSDFAHMQQSARIAPLVQDGRVVGTITVIDDVTERVAYETELVQLLIREQAAHAKAEEANRAKDEFLATVSHELRTPLNAILGWAQVLRSHRHDDVKSAHALEIIERNAWSQAKLIEDILDVSRIITGKLRLEIRPIDLAALITAALDSVRPAAEAKLITLDANNLDSPIGPVAGDPDRVQQVIWNLLSNAIKFTPQSGVVEVKLSRDDTHAQVSITDNGQGISAEFLPHVFDRFRQADGTTRRVHAGLGLGLAIARHLVEMHGGTIRAESPGRGAGATFTVRLPVAGRQVKPDESEPQRAATEPGSSVARPALVGVRVLVVEDDLDTCEVLKIIIGHTGAEVRTACSVNKALEVVRQWKPNVLVSDISMPGEDGYDLIARVRSLALELGGGIPALALTAHAGYEDRLRALSAGYQMHIAKPIEPGSLVAALTELTGDDHKPA